ncbi:hypothetical protein PsorP6_016649 [Peronosclerospora sorghi]|uniref:Uncharacterized protein n=1 Tax=Peronosclerospora sorghi TaxID=230839 RepID=A0ACC0VPJ8_9STRA|nr:hypothetical protein PsorP6_016649 [Peronosclerospora sorghi]
MNLLKAMPMLNALRIAAHVRFEKHPSQLYRSYHFWFDIFPHRVTAWLSGGVEAERKAKQKFMNGDHRQSLQECRDWHAQVWERRIMEKRICSNGCSPA